MRARLATRDGAQLAGEPPLYGRPAPSLSPAPGQHVQWISCWRAAPATTAESAAADAWGMEEPRPRLYERFARIHLRRPADGWRYVPLYKRTATGELVPCVESQVPTENQVSDDRVFSIARQTATRLDLSDATLAWLSNRIYVNTQRDAYWRDMYDVTAYLKYMCSDATSGQFDLSAAVASYMPTSLEGRGFVFDNSNMRPGQADDFRRQAWHRVREFMHAGSSCHVIPKKMKPGTRPRIVNPVFSAAASALHSANSYEPLSYVLGVPLPHLLFLCAGAERVQAYLVEGFGFSWPRCLARVSRNGATVFDAAVHTWYRHWALPLPTNALVRAPLALEWPADDRLQTDANTIAGLTKQAFDKLYGSFEVVRAHARAAYDAAALANFLAYVRKCDAFCAPSARAASTGFSLMHAVAARAHTTDMVEYLVTRAAPDSLVADVLSLVYESEDMRTLGVRRGDTPLVVALRNGCAESARLLLAAGACAARAGTSETPLHVLVASAAHYESREQLMLACDALLAKLAPSEVRAHAQRDGGGRRRGERPLGARRAV